MSRKVDHFDSAIAPTSGSINPRNACTIQLPRGFLATFPSFLVGFALCPFVLTRISVSAT